MSTKQVLITGSPEHVQTLAKVFEAAGIEQVTESQLGRRASEVNYYVQLGVTVPARGKTIVQRVHSFLDDGLLDRFATAERVLPMLADDAVVLLVAGNLPAEMAAPDDRVARLSLLRVLAHAMRADLSPRRVRIRVITSARSDEEIAAFATGGGKDPWAELPGLEPARGADDPDSGAGYDDWRIQVLGLAQIEF